MADVRLGVAIDATGAEQGASRVERAVDKIGRKMSATRSMFGRVTGSITEFAKGLFSLQGLLGGLSVGAIFAGIGSTIRSFNASIEDLQAITGATGKDLLFLRDAAKEFGKTTQLSASQAASAMKLIASAKPDLLDNVVALKAVTAEVVNLSIAAGVELPQAASALGQALNQFGAGAEEAGRFVNVLAAGAKFGASEIPATAAALVNAGTAAHSAGLSFEETVASIQLLAKTGITAEQAGSKLATILTRLQTFGNDKFNPAIVGMEQALRNMKDEGLDTAEATNEMKEIFGQFSINAGRALISLADEFDPLTKKLTGTQTAMEQVAAKTNGLDNDLKQLGSAAENLRIEVGERLEPTFRSMAQGMTELFVTISDNLDAIGQFAVDMLKLGAAIAAAVAAAKAAVIFSTMASGLLSLQAVLTAVEVGLFAFAGAVAKAAAAIKAALLLINPLGVAVGALVGTIAYAALNWEDWTEALDDNRTALDAVSGAVTGLEASMGDVNSMTPAAIALTKERTQAALDEAIALRETIRAQQEQARSFGSMLVQSIKTGGGRWGEMNAVTSELRAQADENAAQIKALETMQKRLTAEESTRANSAAEEKEKETTATKKLTDAEKDAIKARKEARESLDEMTQSLSAQIHAVNAGPVAVAAYDAEHGKLAATLKTAGADAAHYKDQIIELTRALESARVQEQFGDPGERYRKRIAELDQLTLSQEAYNRAKFEAQEALFREHEARSRLSTEQQAMFSLQTSMLQLEKAQAANDPAASLMTQAELYERNNALIQKNIDLLNSQIKALEALPASVSNDEAITRMQIQIEGLRGSIRTVSDDIRDSMQGAMSDAIKGVITGTTSIKEAFQNMQAAILDDMANRFAKDISRILTNAMMPQTNGGSEGFLMSLFSGIFGKREMGGPVAANRPYLVGEKRPEVFVPGTTGQIVPQATVGGATVHLTVVTPNADSFIESKDQIARDYGAALNRAQRFQG